MMTDELVPPCQDELMATEDFDPVLGMFKGAKPPDRSLFRVLGLRVVRKNSQSFLLLQALQRLRLRVRHAIDASSLDSLASLNWGLWTLRVETTQLTEK